jgi:hypothetical protein
MAKPKCRLLDQNPAQTTDSADREDQMSLDGGAARLRVLPPVSLLPDSAVDQTAGL